ncbi:MAG: T9SS type A sorting domain-containing protein [Bacteroidia bacterium]
MKKLYTLGLCFLLCLFLPNLLQADTLEVAGADMSYKWLSGNTYEVNLNIYTKCNYTSLDSVWIKVSSPDVNFKSYTELAKLEDKGELQIDCHNHEHWSSCDDPALPLPGIRKWTATAKFTLSRKDYCQYFFSWESCCRTKIITTGPALNHFYINTYMRICEDSVMSSPYFTEQPYFMAGVNYCNRKQNPVANAGDANSRYEFRITSPKQSPNANVNYSSGYSFTEPFRLTDSSVAPCSPLRINDSGIVSFRPNIEDVSPVAFNLSKYDKNGVLQSRINRDVIYMVIPVLDNRNPIISGINGSNKVTQEYHGGSSICFTIHSFDVDDVDTVFMSIKDSLPPGATFDIETGKRFPKGTFCWTPKQEQARQEPYRFTVKVVDNKFPCGDFDFQGKYERSFEIYVCPNQDCSTIGFEDDFSRSIQLYPQPASNAVFVEIAEKQINSLEITDMAGRIFLPAYIWEGNKLKIDLNHFSQGSYMLKIQTDKIVYTSKLIINK